MSSWLRALQMELDVARIIHRQEGNGVGFDLSKANRYVTYLTDQMDRLYKEVRPYLTTEVERPYSIEIKEPYLASGGYRESVIKWYGDNIPDICGSFSRVEFVDPDIGSRVKLVKQLLDQGWIPCMRTPKGFPKLTNKGIPVPSIERIEAPVGKALAKRFVISHRRSQIQGWIDRVRPDGRLTAGANSCGANTARMRHRGVANVPKASKEILFGYQMRDLFIPRDGYKLVGHDASGLEARIMGHYTFPIDGGVFAHDILEGDIHSKNALEFFSDKLVGKTRGDEGFEAFRDLAKTLLYGLIYGAQVGRVRSVVGCSRIEAQRIFETFWRINPGLGKLRDKVIAIAKKNGWIPGLDGRKIFIRSPHSALNALFQSGGAIVMKQSMSILDHWIKTKGIEAYKVIDMHDEAQAEIPESDIITISGSKEEVLRATSRGIWTDIHKDGERHTSQYCLYGEMAVESIRRAGKVYKLRCDLDAEYKVGNSWAETH